MKYVINGCYGSFELPDEYINNEGCFYDIEDIRTDPELIKIVSSPNYWGDLIVVNIPDDITDTYIVDHDGQETLLYVKDGKIHEA